MPKKENDFAILPAFQLDTPYLADYFGIWSIHEPVFRQIAERSQGMNLHDHLKSQEVRASVAARDSRSFQLTDDGIAVIQIRGAMMKSVPSMGDGTSTARVRQQLKDARRDPAVLGAMLVMDTPGGTVKGNVDLANEVALFAAQKKIFAFIEDMTASAGVSVASQATKRFANVPKAIYGSMGTYGVLVDSSGMAEKLGVKVHVLKAGDYKGIGEEGAPITANQLAEMQRVINSLNESYVELIAAGLKRTADEIRAVADGRVIFAADAVGLGLIDGVQTYEATYGQLVQQTRSAKFSTPPPVRNSQMEPATFAELKAKFPKASAEWRESQMVAKATLEDANAAYLQKLEADAEAREKEHAAALAKATADAKASADAAVAAAAANAPPAKGAGLGGAPIKNGKPTEGDVVENEDAVDDFNSAVLKICGPNATLERRQTAIRAVANRNPELYASYLLACNSGKKQRRMIAEKLEALADN